MKVDVMHPVQPRPGGWLPALALYLIGIVIPVAILAVGVRLGLPPYVFEHLILLVVVGLAVAGGRRPAIAAALAGTVGDNLLLRDPIGRPAITGTRDLIDLLLFLAVAVTVGWLVDSLRAAKARADEAAAGERRVREDRDRLIATLTHDLATPLGAIQGTVRFLRTQAPITGADLDRLLARVETAASRATSLLRALTDARSLEQHALALRRRPVDLRAVVEPIVKMLDHVSDRHPMVLSMADAPLMVDGDPERLGSVVENLIGNAIKYSPAGGVIEVSVGIGPDAVLFAVRDHGIGVAPEDRSRLFDPGFRSPGAGHVAPGLGLGLYIAAEVVRLHSGSIVCNPADGGGTLFTVRLPPSAAASPSADLGDSSAVTPTGRHGVGALYAGGGLGTDGRDEPGRRAAAGP